MIDGEILHGKNGYAAEIAHIPIGDPSLKCPTCGSYGCVESDLNVEHIVRHFAQIDPALPLPEKWRKCVRLLSQDPEQAAPLLNHWGHLLGQVASILINLFDPSDFYVTGYITDIFPLLADALLAGSAQPFGRQSEAQVESAHSGMPLERRLYRYF